jgi:hypothetical protein
MVALTGEDDSIAHSWDTVEVRVVADIDRLIAPVVEVLNQIQHVRTWASCQGRPHSQLDTRAHVMLSYLGPPLDQDRFFGRLEYLTQDLGNGNSVERLAGPWSGDATLWLQPARLSDVVSALKRVFGL